MVGRLDPTMAIASAAPKYPQCLVKTPNLKKKSSQPKAKHVASLYLLYGCEASWGHVFKQFSAATGVNGSVS